MKRSRSSFEMKKSRSSDRLSELPDSLIFNIFEFLPLNDVVRTTILSKRWKDLWRTVPFLNFIDSSFRYEPNITRLQDFVNRALKLWRGIKILKFKIDFRCSYGHVFDDDLNVWLGWAKEKQVEEIHFSITNNGGWEEYCLPECLYSCSSLKVLVLSLGDVGRCCTRENIKLENIGRCCARPNIKWDSLKSLSIHSVYYDFDPEFISQALRGSPNLEVCNLTMYYRGSMLIIQSSSLKKLSIRKPCYERYKELEIVTPNLETLEISGPPYRRCVFSAYSSSLTDVTLRFQEDDFGEDEVLPPWCEEDCGETLSQILPTIQHVERLKLSAWCIQVLQRTNKQHLLLRPYFIDTAPVERNSRVPYRYLISPGEATAFFLDQEYRNGNPFGG